jgi:trans-aconitate methyltransferase
MKTKYPRYQDYVIKDGKLVGDFEEMYRDFEDPWEQTTREKGVFEKRIALDIIRREGYERVMELGCGLGEFTSQIQRASRFALGVDVSPTAIQKARLSHPNAEFIIGDVLDLDIYRHFKPDCIVFSEITWYILEKLDTLKTFLHQEFRGGG